MVVLNVVDEAIRLYNEAQDDGDIDTVKSMRKSFADRIDELEDFYLKHDDGEQREA
jgi:regulator of PEP synthase PpsR (kinase-PPPase family)